MVGKECGCRERPVSLSCFQRAHSGRSLARQLGINLLEVGTFELHDERYRRNSGDRCFYCKQELFSRLLKLPAFEGWRVCDGTHAEDDSSDRPGNRARLELGIASPLRVCGFTKAEIRVIASGIGLANWNKPASPCLASRVPVGTRVNEHRLESAGLIESALARAGYEIYRARIAQDQVRVEVGPGEVGRLGGDQRLRSEIVKLAESRGYSRVFFDPVGYRGGDTSLSTELASAVSSVSRIIEELS